jgi:hypothetical protein
MRVFHESSRNHIFVDSLNGSNCANPFLLRKPVGAYRPPFPKELTLPIFVFVSTSRKVLANRLRNARRGQRHDVRQVKIEFTVK